MPNKISNDLILTETSRDVSDFVKQAGGIFNNFVATGRKAKEYRGSGPGKIVNNLKRNSGSVCGSYGKNAGGFLKQGDSVDSAWNISKVVETVSCQHIHDFNYSGAAKISVEIRGGISVRKRLKVRNLNEMVRIGKGRCSSIQTGAEIRRK